MAASSDPYARTTFGGKPSDVATAAALRLMEGDLGYKLTVYQIIGGAAASSGTHLKGRAVDLAPYDWRRKLRVGLKYGFIGWHRKAVPGLWAEHVHMVLVLGSVRNAKGIAEVAFRQIAAYLRRDDGLVTGYHDSTTHPEDLVPFAYPPKKAPMPVTVNKITEARDEVTEARRAIGEAVVALQNIPAKRRVAKTAARLATGTLKAAGVACGVFLRTSPKK